MGLLTALREDFYPDRPFDDLPADPSFALGAARSLAWAAQLAYEVHEDDKLQRILHRWSWRNDRVIAGRFASHLPLVSTKGFAATTGGGVTVIAFAGTEPTSLLNWITDFFIHRTAEGAHAGFLAGLEAVWDQVREVAGQGTDGLYLTGHSLGGALAAVAARRLLDERVVAPDRLRGVYTIGIPRPGSDAYARDYDAAGGGILGRRTYRLVHGDDIVPKVPPAEPPFGFRHVGRVLACPHGGTFAGGTPQGPTVEEPPAGGTSVLSTLQVEQDLRAAVSAASRDEGVLPPYPAAHPFVPEIVAVLPPPIRDHLPDRYLRALQI
jgi:triacylglycerol lipase